MIYKIQSVETFNKIEHTIECDFFRVDEGIISFYHDGQEVAAFPANKFYVYKLKEEQDDDKG